VELHQINYKENGSAHLVNRRHRLHPIVKTAHIRGGDISKCLEVASNIYVGGILDSP